MRVMSIDPGEIRVFAHAESTPATPATRAPTAKPSVRWRRILYPRALMRIGSSRTPCRVSPNAVRAR